ncbi:hypothetical protein Syun_022360 [Stephania yunnanensis]|uniref:Protein kinase domain-containing protein n=1 Tax=Stephania yunnanensis TaxID=152371 RepID=A0AAP0I354_9MAGN
MLGLFRSMKSKGSVTDHSLENNKMFLKELTRAFDGKRNPVLIFSAKDLAKATRNYDPGLIIHRDSISDLYKGKHGTTNDRPILVEKFSYKGYSDVRERIINELVVLSQINHKHVAKLLGCCLETELPILVYECSDVNKILSDLIIDDHQSSPLSWESRLRIATEIADAITYTHTFTSRPIIHRDVKLRNIILDHQDVARLFGFSLCIRIPDGQTHVEEPFAGTFGFIDPMYVATGQVSEKADVYGFGVVLLQILSGKSFYKLNEENQIWSLTARADLLRQVVDPKIKEVTEQMCDLQLEAYANLIIRCTRGNENERPEMIEVAKELRRIWKASQVHPQ